MLSPRITPTREVVALDGLWRFALDTATGPEPWKARLDTALEVPVPASYNDLFVDSSIRDHVGVVWYQRDVRVPRGWNGERIVLRFGSVTHAAAVYVDDLLVAEHVGGYTPFEADLTDVLEAGKEFRLTVAVDNRLTNLTIPPGSVTDGPRRPRAADLLPRLLQLRRYRPLGEAVQHPHVLRRRHHRRDRHRRHGRNGRLQSSATGGDDVAVRVRVLDESGAEVAVSAGAAGSIRIDDVRLWQPGSAYLYDAGGRAGRRRRTRRQLHAAVRRADGRGARHRVPDQRRAVLLHRVRKARGHPGPRQGPRRRLPRARLPVAGVDGCELLPHQPLSVRRRRCSISPTATASSWSTRPPPSA